MKNEGWIYVCAISIVLVVALVFWVISATLEARSFEQVTGKHVSTWDALFLDLRIMEPAKKD